MGCAIEITQTTGGACANAALLKGSTGTNICLCRFFAK